MPSGGHNKIEFTDKDIQQLEIMSGMRMPVKYIAAILGCSKETLDRRIADTPKFTEAVANGRAKASTKVFQTAYSMATSGKCPSLTIFWLKTQEGWKEPVHVEANVTGIQVTKDNIQDLLKAAESAD